MAPLFSKRQQGDAAEDRALAYLRAAGLELIQRNYRCRRGEIDLIMRDADTVVLVEVRQRSRSDFGTAAESVTVHKQRRLLATARHWLVSHPQHASGPLRFDVVGIDGNGRLDWIANAFQEQS